jgi:putative transposase
MQHTAEIGSSSAVTGESGVDSLCESPPCLEREGRAMPAAKAPSIQLSPDHERELKDLVRAHSTPQKLAERARIILLASDGRGVIETAEKLGIWRKTAGHWRRRGLASEASAGVAERLSDAPRCGAPAIFTPKQICQIMALACEDPERLDVPISQWSQSELARQAVSRVSGDVARDVRQPQHASLRRRGPPGGGAMRHHRRSG